MQLKEWMKANKVSARKLSEMTAYHENHIRYIVRGMRQPGMVFCAAIEKITNGQVQANDMRWAKKERPRCKTCGRALKQG